MSAKSVLVRLQGLRPRTRALTCPWRSPQPPEANTVSRAEPPGAAEIFTVFFFSKIHIYKHILVDISA